MGPHGVLVGATGSGKSELLRSLVAGLAARHAPEELAFVLVDYKGGAAFADLSRLPHVAGLITNLQRDLSLVDRMHAALIGEQERRQTMLREAGNLDDIVAYQARAAGDTELPPMPDLLVIVDEFAELLAARPGVHRPVRRPRARRPLARHPPAAVLPAARRGPPARPREPPALPPLPAHLLGDGVQARARHAGRLPAAVAARPRLPQGGHGEVRAVPGGPGLGRPRRGRPGGRCAGGRAGVRPGGAARGGRGGRRPRGGGPSELQVLVDRLTGDRPPVHQVWVDPLPAAESLDRVLTEPPWWRRQERAEGLLATLGRLDRPSEQRTEPFTVDLAGSGGHLAVVGSPRTGKSTVLRTLAAALIWRHTPDQVRIYGIDLGGGLLGALDGAPHVGRHRRQARPRGGHARRAPAPHRGRGPRERVPRGRARVDDRRPRRRARSRTSSCSSTAGRRSSASSRASTASSRSWPPPGSASASTSSSPPTAGPRSARRCSTTSAAGSSCGCTTRSTRSSRARPRSRCPPTSPAAG